jgi:DNA-binding transcriptional MerR regulator
MPLLTISEVARQVGLQPSAIRYYEQIGILVPAQRIGGQRRFDTSALHRLAVIQRARQTGFTLNEIDPGVVLWFSGSSSGVTALAKAIASEAGGA